MSNEQLIQEAQDCVQWLKSKDIDAYNDAETVYIILDNVLDTYNIGSFTNYYKYIIKT